MVDRSICARPSKVQIRALGPSSAAKVARTFLSSSTARPTFPAGTIAGDILRGQLAAGAKMSEGSAILAELRRNANL